MFLSFSKAIWKIDILFNWTEQEIENADEYGYIGTKYGIDCYINKLLKVTSK